MNYQFQYENKTNLEFEKITCLYIEEKLIVI